MFTHIFSLMDLIQLALMLAACYACYRRGMTVAAEQIMRQLEAAGVVVRRQQEEVDEEEN